MCILRKVLSFLRNYQSQVYSAVLCLFWLIDIKTFLSFKCSQNKDKYLIICLKWLQENSPLGKFPPIRLPPGKFPSGKFPPRKFPLGISPPPPPPISLIAFLHHFLTKYFVHNWAENVHVHPPRMKNFDMFRTAQCSHLRKKLQ